MSTAAARARRLSERGRVERGLAEMVGLVRGVIADGAVSSQEAEHLAEWTRENPEVVSRWPTNILARRLERILLDGRVDGRERRHLASILEQLAENPGGLFGGFPLATDLPLTQPPPEIGFEEKTFLFAGEFAYGPTHACEREIQDRGGTCERTVNRRTDYVVIGSIAAAD